ncbi:MAG: sigma-70 family RNA polymerase sigma factor [Bacteroidaceae bacterium]|nr:sigma-70 family RNA polymerase sigma factor [Bacteroidaceae bacterium]
MEITRLIERCKQGDADALGELYKAYAQRMRGVCRRYISDEQTVEDVLHDAFVIIFTSFDRLRDVRRAEAWMTAITRNVASKCKNHLEALSTVSLDETREADLIVTKDEEKNVRGVPLSEIFRMIDRLPEGYGRVFRLSVFEGISHKEIATMLGIEPHSSSSQLTRAKKMLRKMMQQYWVAGILLLLTPLTFLLRKGDTAVKEEKTVVAKQEDTSKESSKESPTDQPQEPVIVHLPVHRTTVIATDTLQSVIAQAVDSVTSDTLSNIIAQEQIIPDTIATDTTKAIRKVEIPHYDITDLRHDKSKNRNDWHLALAYAGNPQRDMSRTDNYMTMPSLSGSMTRSTKLYNWGDYMDYVMANAPMMDSVSASNMRHVAIINSNHPQDPLTETKRHERPLTLQLSLSRQLNSHWSLATGLSYTRMKSTFESGNENTIIHRTQRLHYLGIPLKLGYRVVGGNRWNLYTTGGIQLDIPVSARLTTQYIYGRSYAPIGNSPDIDATISAPWQWSVGVGIGAQYQIVPHLNIYLEPSLNYFIPTSTDVESYRTAHPFDLSLPFGIRFTW